MRFFAGIMTCVFLTAVPVLGWLSWLFCQEGNWIMTYMTSGLSWLSILIVWKIMDDEW